MNLLKRIFSKKKKDGTRTILAHQELSKEIQTTDAVLLIKHKKTAQQLANLDFKNIAKGTRIKSFLGSLKSDYQKLVDKIDKTLGESEPTYDSIEEKNNTLYANRDTVPDSLEYFAPKRYGLLSHEVAEVFPNLVNKINSDIEAINYVELVPVLIKAIKEQQTIINSQKEINIKQDQQYKTLLSRIEHLEANKSN